MGLSESKGYKTDQDAAQNLKGGVSCHILHCVGSAQIRSFFWSIFSRIRTEYGEIRRDIQYSVRYGKIRTRETPYLDTFHAVKVKWKQLWLEKAWKRNWTLFRQCFPKKTLQKIQRHIQSQVNIYETNLFAKTGSGGSFL